VSLLEVSLVPVKGDDVRSRFWFDFLRLVMSRTAAMTPRWLVFYGCFVGRGDRFGAGERVTQVAVTRDFVDTHWVSGLV